jgi:hypothetical protein
MTDRLMQEILDVLEVIAYPSYELAPSEDAVLRARALYEKLKGAIHD